MCTSTSVQTTVTNLAPVLVQSGQLLDSSNHAFDSTLSDLTDDQTESTIPAGLFNRVLAVLKRSLNFYYTRSFIVNRNDTIW